MMKKAISLFLIIVTFSVSAQTFDKDKLDQYLKLLEVNEKAMLSVALVKNGQSIYQNSIGFADIKVQQKATSDTQYRIGSISKTYTATMIFQLIDEGKLSLATKLSQFYPAVKNAEKITVSMLLGHRSGIHNFTDLPEYSEYMEMPKSQSEMLKIIEDLESDFAPDSRASYSNSGYVLLGFILEKIEGERYANVLYKRIVKPLKLVRTAYGSEIDIAENQANSYSYNPSQWLPATVTDMSIPHGAGAIISTPTEVGLFMSHLFAGKLVSADSLTKMKEINEGYGRGLFQFPFYDKTLYGHTGGIDGFSSLTGYFEAEELAVTLTSNGMNYSMNGISIGVLSIFYGLPFELPNFDKKAITLEENELLKYEGTFVSQALPLKITIKLVDGQLTAQATGQQPISLTAFSNNDFRFEPAGIVMLFGTNDGKVDYANFNLKQGGGDFAFTKE